MTDTIKTMKLNHLSFPSLDHAATAAFFEKHLGFEISARLDGHTILKRPGFDVVINTVPGETPAYPKTFHVGFELPDVEAVRALYDRFKREGIDLQTDIFNNNRGSRFFCTAPGGLTFELNTRADASPEYRGTFDN